MSEQEAREVARIMNDADGGCSSCATSLHKDLKMLCPEYAEAIQEEYEREYGSDEL